MTAIVEVDGVARSFGETRALQGVDLEVPEGRVVALLGPNGAGKTTLVRILATLLEPDVGTARINGFDVRSNPMAVRRSIGLAGQYAAVDGTLTGRENLEMIGRLSRLSRLDVRPRIWQRAQPAYGRSAMPYATQGGVTLAAHHVIHVLSVCA